MWILCLQVSETYICALPMLGKQISAVHLITEGVHSMAFFLNCNHLQGTAKECILSFQVNE